MPTYEYACKDCGEHLEVVQSFRDEALTECPNCEGALRKVFSAAGIIFKGSGWHVKDYASSGGRPAASANATDESGGSDTAKDSASSEGSGSDTSATTSTTDTATSAGSASTSSAAPSTATEKKSA